MTDISITKPDIQFGINRNVFEWKPLKLKVVVDRITEDAKAEVYIYHQNGSGQTLLHMAQANLLSSTMQREFIKALSTRGLELDWQTILTYITHDTIEHLRQGEPVLQLNDGYGKTKPEYLLPPLFVKDAPNIIYADRSSAKSLFAILVDISLTLPWTNNPLGFAVGSDCHKVLYCDWESSPNIIGWLEACLLRGIGLEWCDAPYLHCSGSLADNIYQIQGKVQDINADVVIIDSLGMAVGDDLNLTKPAFAFFSALRQLPCTPIIIGHTAKSLEAKRRTVYGNAYYENEARSVWEIVKQQQPMSNELSITLFQRKSPPFAPLHEALAYKFSFDGDTTSVSLTNPASDKGMSEEPSQPEIILALLEDSSNALTPKEIANETKLEDNTVRVVLGRLVKAGKLAKQGNGYVALT